MKEEAKAVPDAYIKSAYFSGMTGDGGGGGCDPECHAILPAKYIHTYLYVYNPYFTLYNLLLNITVI